MADSELHFIRDGIHTHLALPAEILLQLCLSCDLFSRLPVDQSRLGRLPLLWCRAPASLAGTAGTVFTHFRGGWSAG